LHILLQYYAIVGSWIQKRDFWELQQEVVATQENIWWFEGELKREKKRMTRLQKALTVAAEAAKGN
jgi:hypothetical protein